MADQPVQRVYWPKGQLTCSLLARVMVRVMVDNIRNAICVRTKTSRVPTRVALLKFISYSVTGVSVCSYEPGFKLT